MEEEKQGKFVQAKYSRHLITKLSQKYVIGINDLRILSSCRIRTQFLKQLTLYVEKSTH